MPKTPMPGPHTILVVEDEFPMATAIRFALEKAGFTVVLAEDGQEAWDHLQSHKVDLVVTDHLMPRMQGTELCERIAADPRFRGLPVVLVTAKAMELDVNQLHDLHLVDAIVSKPFSPRNLVLTVRELLKELDQKLKPQQSVAR